MTSLESLLNEAERRVAEDIPVSPIQWLDLATKVNSLRGTLDNEIAAFEASLVKLEAEYIRQDKPAAKAKILARSDVDYEGYLKAKAVAKRVEETLRLAKKYSQIKEYNV